MKRSPGPRKTVKLADSAQQHLDMYALAASAAGVGLLALAQPLEARVIYTPANIPINVNGRYVELDLNHDGINDFQFYANFSWSGAGRGRGVPATGYSWSGSWLKVGPAQQSNRLFAVESQNRRCASALKPGRRIGRASPFQPGNSTLTMAYRSAVHTSQGVRRSSFGPWLHVSEDYVGLKFVIKGKVHFGWARIKMTGSGFAAIITGYAYETISNKHIITWPMTCCGPGDMEEHDPGPGASLTNPIPDKPQSASLGTLALGAQGVPLWRRAE